jgi:hypothetical protein
MRGGWLRAVQRRCERELEEGKPPTGKRVRKGEEKRKNKISRSKR